MAVRTPGPAEGSAASSGSQGSSDLFARKKAAPLTFDLSNALRYFGTQLSTTTNRSIRAALGFALTAFLCHLAQTLTDEEVRGVAARVFVSLCVCVCECAFYNDRAVASRLIVGTDLASAPYVWPLFIIHSRPVYPTHSPFAAGNGVHMIRFPPLPHTPSLGRSASHTLRFAHAPRTMRAALHLTRFVRTQVPMVVTGVLGAVSRPSGGKANSGGMGDAFLGSMGRGPKKGSEPDAHIATQLRAIACYALRHGLVLSEHRQCLVLRTLLDSLPGQVPSTTENPWMEAKVVMLLVELQHLVSILGDAANTLRTDQGTSLLIARITPLLGYPSLAIRAECASCLRLVCAASQLTADVLRCV